MPENLSSQLEQVNFILSKLRYHILQGAKNKGADWTVQMSRLVCTIVVCMCFRR